MNYEKMTKAELIRKLKLHEEQFKHTFEQVAVGIAHVELNGQFIKVNRHFCDITGYLEQEILKSTFHNITYPDDINMQNQIRKKVLEGEKSSYTIEKRYIKKDKSVIWVSLTVTLIRKSGGLPHYFISIIKDITEKKKMQEALLQSEKLKFIGTIASGVSHEFNNILAIISGNIQLLEETCKEQEELTDGLRTIKRAADDGAEMSRSVLNFTKTAKDTTGYAYCDIRDLIKQSIDFTMPKWKNMAKAKGIHYYLDRSDVCEVPAILCNSTKIRLVFVNIINNALDAMPDGGRIGFCTWVRGDTVFVTISDTGEGMSDEVKQNIFDPFFTTKASLGSGLGMSTAFGIITGHGGKMEVESEMGKGSTFSLQLPVLTKVDSKEE